MFEPGETKGWLPPVEKFPKEITFSVPEGKKTTLIKLINEHKLDFEEMDVALENDNQELSLADRLRQSVNKKSAGSDNGKVEIQVEVDDSFSFLKFFPEATKLVGLENVESIKQVAKKAA